MKRGNERLEMLRSGIGMPRERIVGPIAGKKISRDDPQTLTVYGGSRLWILHAEEHRSWVDR